MDFPTLDQIRLRSDLLATSFPDPAGNAKLTVLVEDASALVSSGTGLIIGTPGTGPFGCPLEEVPANFIPVVLRAVAYKAEYMSLANTAAARRAQIKRQTGGLASFSAGPYSESYFQPGSGSSKDTGQIDPDPVMDGFLKDLMTDCVRVGWQHQLDPSTPYPPAYALESQDWFPEGSHGLGRGCYFNPDGW